MIASINTNWNSTLSQRSEHLDQCVQKNEGSNFWPELQKQKLCSYLVASLKLGMVLKGDMGR
jgi:hypothetical protein